MKHIRASILALVALLSASSASAQSVGSFPLSIHPLTDHIHTAGDSLMVGGGNLPYPGMGYLSPIANTINAAMALHQASLGRPAVATSSVGAAPVSAYPTQIAWTQDAISGTTIQQLADAVSTRVMAYAPSGDGSNWTVIIDVSPNDWTAFDRGTPAVWTTPAATIVTTIRATKPNTRIVFVSSIFGLGEQWVAAPSAAWGLNSADIDVEGLNGIASTWAAANGCYYVDIRGEKTTDPNTMANAESTLNTPAPGVATGVVTFDGEHPIITSGQLIFAARFLTGWLNVIYPN